MAGFGGAGRGGQGREVDAGLVPALSRLVDPATRGDPESPLRWTTKSTEKLAGELASAGHRVSADTVGRLLKEDGYSLQGNAKTVEGSQHPDRDGQFRLINTLVRAFQAAGEPVISVDTKKKELVGNYRNGGKEWHPGGEPERVQVHDFKGELGRAVPYGVYDMTANAGWVNVGTDADTGAFAVESIRRWWENIGKAAYPHATRLLITADAGGSNGSRLRLWKVELARLAQELGLEISVSHFPPGTSKWNRIEHRLFAQISMNWRGRPLTSHEVIVETIAATTTKTGLTVQAALDTGIYQKGIKISDKEMKALEQHSIRRHDFHGEWNLCLAIPWKRGHFPLADSCNFGSSSEYRTPVHFWFLASGLCAGHGLTGRAAPRAGQARACPCFRPEGPQRSPGSGPAPQGPPPAGGAQQP